MKATALMILIAIPVLLVGCGQPQTDSKPAPQTVAVAPAREPWQIKRDHLLEVIKVGMSEDEVTKAVGDPDRTVSQGGAIVTVKWQYDLGDGNWFDVRFDKSNRVAVAELDQIKVMN